MHKTGLHGLTGTLLLTCLGLLPGAAGCGNSTVDFRLNREGETASHRILPARAQQQELVNGLTAVFGTPDRPYAWPESGLDQAKLDLAAGPAGGDGETGGLYRRHCAHCHGVTGDGLGPTARFLNPYPRDYRRGEFKFTSTGQNAKPTKDDLRRTLIQGINGTAMPSFKLLPPEEIDALVEYVKYLSLRGQVELELANLIADELTNEEDGVITEVGEITPSLIKQAMEYPVESWNDAENQVVTPSQERYTHEELMQLAAGLTDGNPPRDPHQASILVGQSLFRDVKRANCIKCHGPTGLGDGGQNDYDVWNKGKTGATPEETAEKSLLYSLPPQEAVPRNLRLGIFRGGRRPVDIYRRMFVGIKGTPMPGQGKILKPQELWCLVDYVFSLPYEDQPHGHEPELTAQRVRP